MPKFCHCCSPRRRLLLLARQRPPLPVVVVIAATAAVPLLRELSLSRRSWFGIAVVDAAAAAADAANNGDVPACRTHSSSEI